MSEAILSVSELGAERSGRLVFSGLSFVAGPGTALRIAGANGAGKTTLLRILAGLSAPAAGSVQWATCRRIFVGHAHAMNDSLDVIDNLRYAARLAGLSGEETALRQALARLEVAHLARRRYGSLSQGQRKRASLARLFLSSADAVWLLDEPFVALDHASQRQLAELIDQRVAAGGLVLYTSHQEVALSGGQLAEVAL